jgi:hypothetical protein
MTAMILPSQFCVRERRKTVITSGHPLSFDIGFSLNSSSRTFNSHFLRDDKYMVGLYIQFFRDKFNRHFSVLGEDLVEQCGYSP